MKRVGRFVGVGLLVLVLVLLAAISLTIGWKPILGPRARALTDRKFAASPERLARGSYLANAVMGCTDCHSEHDWKAPGGPPVAARLGAGEVFPERDLPGSVIAPNLTPDRETGAGNWSDDQLARAIREGIGYDGRALFPLMPYQNFRALSDEDLASVIVYLRSLPPVRNPLPRTRIDFPVRYLMRNAPDPVTTPVPAENSPDPIKRGEYIARMAHCNDCHTPKQHGQPNEALAFAGGAGFHGPFGTVTSANITPDASGIAYYDEAAFISALRTGKVGARNLNPLMRWIAMRALTDDDLRAMFAYLRTLKPIAHRVDNTEPPTFCKICQGKHGGGDKN